MLAAAPLAGAIADRAGRRPTLVVLALLLAMSTPPLFALLGRSPLVTVAAAAALAITAGAWSAVPRR
jgi:MFS family permease